MHGPMNSLARVWYRLGTRRRLARNEWAAQYWEERDGSRVVACRHCPKFDPKQSVWSVPFGSPLRQCVAGCTEAHLHDPRGARVLELGYARHSYGKRIIELFNQPQHQPVPVEIQVALLWMVQNGHVDSVPVARLKEYQSALTEYLTMSRSDVLERIVKQKSIDEPLIAQLQAAADQFKTVWA
jgi:hypothetical protein